MDDFQQYKIDYENGTIPIGDLPIGDRVVDPSWEWEHITGDYYRGSGSVRSVTWLVVAKDHYGGLEPHVTLLAEELICKYPFDNSSNRGSQVGCNHWGESGTGNASRGLRPWLNSSGIHAEAGFCRAFSANFRRTVLATDLPNKERKDGTAYSTIDYVFLPSTTELGDSTHNYTYRIGSAFPYFQGASNADRVAIIGEKHSPYWTRSPYTADNELFLPADKRGAIVRTVRSSFVWIYKWQFDAQEASYPPGLGVRPALNLKSETLVSEIKD